MGSSVIKRGQLISVHPAIWDLAGGQLLSICVCWSLVAEVTRQEGTTLCEELAETAPSGPSPWPCAPTPSSQNSQALGVSLSFVSVRETHGVPAPGT